MYCMRQFLIHFLYIDGINITQLQNIINNTITKININKTTIINVERCKYKYLVIRIDYNLNFKIHIKKLNNK